MSNYMERIAAVKDASEIFDNPNYFGFPTFQEFAANKEKYLGRPDDALAQVDAGSRQLDKHVQRHFYEIEGYRCNTLEEVERVAASQGIALHELDYRPTLIPQTGKKCDILIKFVSKHEREKRAQWG